MRIKYKELFEKLKDTTVMLKAHEYAYFTLPYLIPDASAQDRSQNGRLPISRDFQEIGALLTNNLASKLGQILFPTQTSFFQIEMSGELKDLAKKAGKTDEDLRQSLAKLEVDANRRLFINGGYAALTQALRHLIVTGNCLLHRDSKNGRNCVYGLDRYVTKRDGAGGLLDCVFRECTSIEALPQAIQGEVRALNPAQYGRPERKIEIYTRIQRVNRGEQVGYMISQECEGMLVGRESWYPEHLCPWMAVTWNLVQGEHYGRGMVEDYAGGFAKLSNLSESAALYGIEMMRVIHLVSAGSGADIDDIAKAESGEYVRGDPAMVQAHESGDAQKLAQISADIEQTSTRLARAFMYQGGTRNAERVTAYEIKRDAEEVEHTLGGVYSILSGGMQIPLAHMLMLEVSDEALAGIVSGEIRMNITAGIPALGRSADVQNLLLAAQELAAILPITQLDKRLDPQRIVDLVFAGRSVDTSNVFYTKQQQAALAEAENAQQAAQMQLVQAQGLADQGKQIQSALGA